MAGLVPAIYVFRSGAKTDVDARPKAGHDERREHSLLNILICDRPADDGPALAGRASATSTLVKNVAFFTE